MAMPTEKMSDFQTAGLKRILQQAWLEKGSDLTIDCLAKKLIEDDPEETRMTDLGRNLYPYSSEGEYGRYFNGKNNVNFDARLVVLELEELKQRKTLQRTILLFLMYQIQQSMYRGKEVDIKQLCVIDEAWDLLLYGGTDGKGEGSDISNFIENGIRRARKRNGAFCIVTQGIGDLYQTASGRAIAENSPNKWLLGQRPETINKLRETGSIDLTDGGYELIKTVHTVPGEYSEIFIHSPLGQSIVRLVVDRYSQLLFSTKPDEVNAINRRLDQGMSIQAAITAVMRSENARYVA
jgi:conjugal transfer ATP-binding protein TraC